MWAFLSPIFLVALAAAVIPLLLHLLRKRRRVPIPFSAVRFLRQAQKQSARRLRLENFLLWLLRTALLLALALAFGQPVLRTASFGGWLGQAQRDVAIVWDASFSLLYETGRGPVWEEARAAALGIVNTLQPGDRVCLFLAGEDVVPLLARPTSDHHLARTLIQAQQPRRSGSRLRPAVAAAVASLRESGARARELFILTDGQALPWAELTEAPEEPTFVALLGAMAPQNAAPLQVSLQPSLLLTNTTGQLTVTWTQIGLPQETTVTLWLNEKEVGRRSASGVATFSLPPLAAGVHAGRVETPADPLALDNVFYFLVRVRERLPVLLAATEADAFFLRRALQPAGAGVDLTRVEPADLAGAPLEEYSCLILANALPVPGQAQVAVEKFVEEGGTLVIFPGDRAAAADYASWRCLPAVPTGWEEVAEPTRRPIRLVAARDPIFADLKLPPGSAPAVTVRRGLAGVTAGEMLLSVGDQMPLLVGRTFGRGRVLLFTVAADRTWSDLPLTPMFLPILHQIVHVSAGLAAERLFEWGEQPGIERHPDRAVNVPRVESNLTPLEAGQEPLPGARVARDVPELLRQIQQHRQGRPLAEWLLWLALVLAMAELFFANRGARGSATVPAGGGKRNGRPGRPGRPFQIEAV
jgi:hypothetical protein